MFKILLSTLFLSLVLVPALASTDKRNVKNGPACELCTIVLTAAKSYLANNQTDAQVLVFIEKELCARLGPLNGTCVNFLETTGAVILADLTSGLDPQTVCKKFALCSARVFSKRMKLDRSFDDLLTADRNSLNCTICKIVMTQVQNLIKSNQSEAQIIAYVDQHVCKLLGPLSTLCDSFVATYGPEAIKLISQKVDPEKVCEILGMCSNSTTTAQAYRKKVNRMKERKTMRSKSGPACELCTLVLGAAKNLLQKNESEAQVLSFIEKELCARLGPLNGTCVNFLETSGAVILADLANGLDPEAVCKKFGLCTASRLSNKLSVLDPNPLECTVCQYVIQFLDLELKGNKTEAAIVNALKNVCKFTPASLRDQCDNLVSTYGVYLVQLLLEFSDPLKVCQALKVC